MSARPVETQHVSPDLRILHGAPPEGLPDEELAALTAALVAMARGVTEDEEMRERSVWLDRSRAPGLRRRERLPLIPGPHAWWASGLPR